MGGTTAFFDAVFGDTEFSNDDIEDFMLLRSGAQDARNEEFGQPMYQLSVVVDDIDMRITHVIRGADHLSNTPKQVLLYRALDAARGVLEVTNEHAFVDLAWLQPSWVVHVDGEEVAAEARTGGASSHQPSLSSRRGSRDRRN